MEPGGGMIHIGRDITQKKRLESIANAATLMDSIGYVFSGIRHEIGNPVNTAKLVLTVLKEKLSASSTGEIGKNWMLRWSSWSGLNFI